METTKRADELEIGDELKLDDGSRARVRGLNSPGSEWNPRKTIVRIKVGKFEWESWPASKLVAVVSGVT